METLETISAALKIGDTKKEGLKKAFDELQSHSSLLSTFSLAWSDLDAHFTALHKSLAERFHVLESLELDKQTQKHCTESTQLSPKIDPCASQGQNAQTNPEGTSSPSISETQTTQIRVDPSGDVGSDSMTPPRPELRALCESMDGKGLRWYVSEHPNEKKAIMAELPSALRCAPEPAAMVLDAIEGFYGVKEGDLGSLRRSCVLLLEALMVVKANVEVGVKERAKKLALEWKGKASSNEFQNFEVMGFLFLVAAYRLRSEFDVDELVDCFVMVAQLRQALKLCRVFVLGDKVADLIQKLINKRKQLLAVKFIFEFQLTKKFPPVPLLKSYLKDANKADKKVWKEGNQSHMSLNKELSAIKSVIKIIVSHNLDSQFPSKNLEKRIESLENLIANRKRPAAALPVKPQQQPKKQKKHLQPKKKKQQQQQSRSKHPQISPPVGRAAIPVIVDGTNSTIPHYRQSRLQSAGLLLDYPAPYVSSSSVPYGMGGQTPTSASFTGLSAGLYSLSGATVGFGRNRSPSSSYLFSSESRMPSDYHDRPTAYGGYAVPPEYHPSYYTQ